VAALVVPEARNSKVRGGNVRFVRRRLGFR
jgi:hypothetical protein